jgi:hypothetical protein
VSSSQDGENGVAEFMDQPCIGAVQGFDFLEGMYRTGPENEVFRSKILELKRRYSGSARESKSPSEVDYFVPFLTQPARKGIQGGHGDFDP